MSVILIRAHQAPLLNQFILADSRLTQSLTMLNLYAALGLPYNASKETIITAINQAEHNQLLPDSVLQSARRFLLHPQTRASYDQHLQQALAQGVATSDWQEELSQQLNQLSVTTPHTTPSPYQGLMKIDHTPHTPVEASVSAQHKAQTNLYKMQTRHWFALIVCSIITVILIAVLWQMAQVQMYQSEQITALQKMSAERRLPEDWPTWEQLNGETFLTARESAQSKLIIYKNATQDLPVMLLPSNQRIDCGQRGNQFCAVTFTFDSRNPHTYSAQIVGSSLVFNDMKQLPYLMHELSQSSSIKTQFPQGVGMPELTFERNANAQKAATAKGKN